MDFSLFDLTPEQQAFAKDVTTFLDANLTQEVYDRVRPLEAGFDEEFVLALGRKGWITPRWSKEDGGADLDTVSARILALELGRRLAPTASTGVGLVWPAVDEYAVPDLRAELKPKVASGEVRFCLGYSEPDGGSDIAGAKTRAVRDGDEWTINGSKIFTTNAQNCQYTFLITRTDPTAPKHKGLTMFLVPLDTPGIEIQALRTIGEERTNIVYYSDVRISDRYRLGDVNKGWSVLHGPLDKEHSIGEEENGYNDLSIGRGHMRYFERALDATVRWAKDAKAEDGTPVIDDPIFLKEIGRISTEYEVARATPGPLGRIKGAEVAIRESATLMDLVGPRSLLSHGAEGAIEDGAIEFAHRASQVTATYGGTTEVFRTIIAQHILGLPRPSYPGRNEFLQKSGTMR